MDLTEVKQKNVLTLAFLGDSYYTFKVKEFFVINTNSQINSLHTKSSNIVKAKAQAKIFELLEPTFTEEEKDIARRAINSSCNNVAKNATREEYKRATALEAIVGFCLLVNNEERLKEILKLAIEK